MRRKPLRPLAHIIAARQDGKNPDFIEAKERSERNQVLQQKTRVRAENRLLALGLIFIIGFSAVGGKMAMLASSSANEVRQYNTGSKIINQRANIVDRNGNILATNMSTQALYAQPPLMINPKKAADDLLRIFPDLNHERVTRNFTSGKRKFVWVKKSVSPEQQQQVHDLGEPGLLFGNREMRLYPNGKLAAHILGGTRFGEEGVKAAEIVGVGGVEKYFDDMLRDPALEGKPLELSIDLTAQAATRQVLKDGMRFMNAKGASAILMDVSTGEIISLVSLPDFDPNNRPRVAVKGDPSDNPLFNRAAQGLYELGSTFKIFTAATSLEKGLANPQTIIDTTPFKWNRKTYKDYKNYGPTNSVEDIIMKSSNDKLKASNAAPAIPGATNGRVTFLKVSSSLAYKSIAACSRRGSNEAIRALTVTTTNEIQNTTWAMTVGQNPGLIWKTKKSESSDAPKTISGVAIGKKIKRLEDERPLNA